MKFLVTGATGHIGNVLVRELIKKNIEITVVVLENENLEPIEGFKVNIVYGDIRDKKFISDLIDKDTVVFHLAGIVDIGINKPELIYDVNVNGTKNIVDACIENKAKKLIYTSSVHIIDPVPKTELREPEIFDENIVEGEYAKTKTISTKYVLDACKKKSLNAVIVYPSGVIGPYDYKLSELGQLTIDILNKKIFAYINGGYNFVDVRDVVAGIIGAYEKGKSGEGYILSGEYVSIKNLFKIINKRSKNKGLPPLLSIGFVRMLVRPLEKYYLKRNKKPLFTKYSLYTLRCNSNFSYNKAHNEFGYFPRNIEESINDTIDWFIKFRPELIKFKRIKIKDS